MVRLWTFSDPLLLQEAGIPKRFAPTVGISVDSRRQNLSEESLKVNVERLKAYKERLIVFPRKSNNPKKGDTKANPRELEKVTLISSALPLPTAAGFSEIKKSDLPAPVEGGAYRALRMARANKRAQGPREKREREKAEAETAKK